MDCLFCKISSGDAKSLTIYENDEARAFLDIHPLTLGHTVIISKRHITDIIDLPQDLILPLFGAVKKATEMLAKALDAENFTIGINHGKMLGHPDIDHMHVHVIPRFEGDGGGDIHSIVKNPPTEELEVTRDRIMDANS